METATKANITLATFHEIRVRTPDSAWCRLLWEDGGQVIILSDYGHWAYWWGYCGNLTVREFLAQLDAAYMGGKMLGAATWEFCETSTIKAVREFILDERKRGGMSKGEAAEEWERLDDWENGYLNSAEWHQTTRLEDPYEFHRTELASDWRNFWERLWVPLVLPILKGVSD